MTGWTWDYVRSSITLKRYEALRKSWTELPPLAVTAFAIARAFGMETKTPRKSQQSAASGDVFYDESYYENTAATPWNESAADSLTRDFETASGVKA